MASDEIESLENKWGEETLQKAFWLQAHIKQEGLDGINFLHDEGTGPSAEGKMKQVKYGTVKSTIEGAMDSSY